LAAEGNCPEVPFFLQRRFQGNQQDQSFHPVRGKQCGALTTFLKNERLFLVKATRNHKVTAIEYLPNLKAFLRKKDPYQMR
jgi:hypothetical protein